MQLQFCSQFLPIDGLHLDKPWSEEFWMVCVSVGTTWDGTESRRWRWKFWQISGDANVYDLSSRQKWYEGIILSWYIVVCQAVGVSLVLSSSCHSRDIQWVRGSDHASHAFLQSFSKERQNGFIYFSWSPGSRSCDPRSCQGSQDLDPGLQEKSMDPFCVSFGKAWIHSARSIE